MNPNQRNQVIGGVLLAVVIGGVVWFTMFRTPSANPGAASPAAGATKADAKGEAKSVFDTEEIDIPELMKNIKEVEFQYEEERESRDPMAPLLGSTAVLATAASGAGTTGGSKASPQERLLEASRKSLTGILWDQHNPLAILDDLVVSVGFQFEPDFSITVKEITASTVVLIVDLGDKQQEITKELKKPDDARPPEESTDS